MSVRDKPDGAIKAVIVYDDILDLELSWVPQEIISMVGSELCLIKAHSIVIWRAAYWKSGSWIITC